MENNMINRLRWAARWLIKYPNVPMGDAMQVTYADNKLAVDMLAAEIRAEEEEAVLQQRQSMMTSTARFSCRTRARFPDVARAF